MEAEKMLDLSCCVCREPLRSRGRCVNLVALDRLASWAFPTWGNVLISGCDGRAVAVVCDSCIAQGADPVWAVEFVQGCGVRYHRTRDLPPVPPAATPPLRFVEGIKS